jgi:molybdate transport system substrate-binding protein
VRRRPPAIGLAAAVAALAAAPSCSARTDDAAPVTVFAAASLRDAFETLARTLEAKRPGARVRLNLAGSQELRLQIEQGARADVFASADPRQMAKLAASGLAPDPVVFARNQLVVITPPIDADPATSIRTFADLPRARRIVVGAPEVPVGAYTREVLQRASATRGAELTQAIEERIASRELNVRQVLAKVVLGEADAGIVYRTDALSAGGKVRTVEIPPDINATTAYVAAALKDGGNPPGARAFIELLSSPVGQSVLGAAGFAPPGPAVSPPAGQNGRAQPQSGPP